MSRIRTWVADNRIVALLTILLALLGVVIAGLALARDLFDLKIGGSTNTSETQPTTTPSIEAREAPRGDPLAQVEVGDCVSPTSDDPEILRIATCADGVYTVVRKIPLQAELGQRDAVSEKNCKLVPNSDEYTWSDGADKNGNENPFTLCLKRQ